MSVYALQIYLSISISLFPPLPLSPTPYIYIYPYKFILTNMTILPAKCLGLTLNFFKSTLHWDIILFV